MNKRLKTTIITGAALATIGLGAAGTGLASAASDSTNPQASLIEKLAAKFNVSQSDVEAVFTADRQEHQAQMQADMVSRLAQAVTDGKMTQAQAGYITNAQKEIEALMQQASPGQETDAQRQAVRDKIDALRIWATQNNVDEQYVGPGNHRGPGSPGGPNSSSDSSSTSK